MTTRNKNTITAWIVLLLLAASVSAQSGGDFTITQSVIAGGGGQQSTAGTFSLDGTVGQAVAGNASTGSPFAVTAGFWNFTLLEPTSASVTVGGRVRTAAGSGIQNAIITMTSQNGSTRSTRSTTFGYYRFDNVMVGETYILNIATRRFTFSQPTIVISVIDEITELDFVADQVP